jgi:DHA1 family inner membrane transport protein
MTRTAGIFSARPDESAFPLPPRLYNQDRMPWSLLIAASLGMFTAAASGTTRAPFLIDMARDLSTSVPLWPT